MTTKQIIKSVFILLAVAVIIRGTIFDTFAVKGDSMLPNIKDGDYVVINRLAYAFSEPKRGDVVVVRPRDSLMKIVKRVIGLPGERVAFDKDKIIIKENRGDVGKVLEEIYLKGDTTRGNQEVFYEVIDPYEYYTLGDNRDVSVDSRRLGPVDKWSIKGKVIFVFSF